MDNVEIIDKIKDKIKPYKLNLGAGNDCGTSEFITIDIKPLPNIDLILDISKGLPFPDNSVDFIKAHDCLEHVENIKFVLQEMYRVCQHGAIWDIRVPYWANITAVNTLTHRNFFSENTFSYFEPNNKKDIGSGWHEWGWNVWVKCLKQQHNYHSSALQDIGPRGSIELERAKTYFINVVDTMSFIFIVIKEGI